MPSVKGKLSTCSIVETSGVKLCWSIFPENLSLLGSKLECYVIGGYYAFIF